MGCLAGEHNLLTIGLMLKSYSISVVLIVHFVTGMTLILVPCSTESCISVAEMLSGK